MLVGLFATIGFRIPEGEGADLEPSRHWPEMAAPSMNLERGPVIVTAEYKIDACQSNEFVKAMQPMRQASGCGAGALCWDLFQDAANPERFVEVFLVESVAEHLRQHERGTAADQQVQERVQAFHKGNGPPVVAHLVAGEPPIEDHIAA